MTTDSDKIVTPVQSLCAALVDQLRGLNAIRTGRVADAFRAVPRHLFAPEAPVAEVYSNQPIVTKRDERGLAISTVSAPRIQAFMLEQADIQPGMRVLEIGSGGVNAAYIAELVGEGGEVTTMDIDPFVVDRAMRFLPEAGYEHVNVVLADGEFGVPEHAPYDRIVVTVGAWDIPPAWWEQLSPGGRIVVPIRVRSLNRSVAFQLEGEHLVSRSIERAGFVAMQGAGAFGEEVVYLHGDTVALRVDDGQQADGVLLAAALKQPRVELWSGVTVGDQEPFDDLDMFLATSMPGFCLLTAHESAVAAGIVQARPWGSSAVVDGGAFAYVVLRQLGPDSHEFGVYGHGSGAEALAARVVEQINTWQSSHRGGPAPVILAHPMGTPADQLAGGLVIDKKHTRFTVSWSR
ncbi:methyltransferase, FxLD system [Kitasatospora sp. NPDC056651]|uniref:methyltransferase, FxLD system n=1 Tax=Kitasatospora sp. NPDC056651 TaxID=3345892 RepID=UPI0036C38964